MDRTTFERKCQQIRQGEFPTDPSIFAYASDSFYELRILFDALKQCCDWQKQKIQILRKLYNGLETSLKNQTKRVTALEGLVRQLGGNPDEAFPGNVTKGADSQ